MGGLVEAMGMMLPGGAAIPAPYRESGWMAYETGRRIVGMVHENLRPSDILTKKAFENAVVTAAALGGSTDHRTRASTSRPSISTSISAGVSRSTSSRRSSIACARVAALGSSIRFGLRINLIVRETEEEAWAAADRLISRVTDDIIAEAQQQFTNVSESVGQKRISALHQGRRDKLVVAPNLWAGLGLVRGGAGTALVGSAENVAARIREYQAIGVETFITSAYPHLEEIFQCLRAAAPGTWHRGRGRTCRTRLGPRIRSGEWPRCRRFSTAAAGCWVKEAMMPTTIGFSGNITRPSRTFAFVDHVVQEIAGRTGLAGLTYDIEATLLRVAQAVSQAAAALKSTQGFALAAE